MTKGRLEQLRVAGDKLTGIKERTRKQLKAVKAGIEQKRAEYEKGATFDMAAFEKDLRVSGASQKEIEWAKKKAQEALPKGAVIMDSRETPEGRTLHTFVKREAIAGAKKLEKNPDKAKEAARKIEKYMEGLPGGKSTWKTIVAGIFTWFKLDPNKGFGKILAKLFGIGKKKKKPEAPKATTAKTPPAAPAQKEAAKKAAEQQKKYVDLFKAKGLTLRTPEIAQDLQTLEKRGVKETDISMLLDTAMKPEGNLDQVLKAVKEAVPNKAFSLRLTDLLYQQKEMTPEKLKRVVTAIKDKDSKVPKTLKDIRTFLDDVNTDFAVAMKKYEKTTT